MDITHPVYRQYSERIIRRIAERYAKHPAVIGWQIDNETGPYGTAGPNVQAGFKEWLKREFGTVEKMNEAWGLVYWGQLVDSWDHLPPRDGIINPGWKLEWERYSRSLVTDFLALAGEDRPRVRARPRSGSRRTSTAACAARSTPGTSRSSSTWPPSTRTTTRRTGLDGWWIACMGDFTRSLKHAPYLVTETNAQAIGWDARGQFPPYDGQLRLQAWANVASGAHMVEYLALALAALRPGDVLEGTARPRPRTQPRLRGGDAHRRGVHARRAAARRHDDEEPRRDPAQRRLALRAAVHADRDRHARRARDDRRPTTSPSRTSCTRRCTDERRRRLRVRRGGRLHRLRRAAGSAALRRERRAAREDRRVREGGRTRAAHVEERLHQRVGHRALDARARTVARGGRGLLPGVLEPEGAAAR